MKGLASVIRLLSGLAQAVELRLTVLALDLTYLRYGGIGILWREIHRQPGPALEMMALDSTNWRVLIDPIPDSFREPIGLAGPLPLWAYGAKWWFFYRSNQIGERCMRDIAERLRAQRPPCAMDTLLQWLRPHDFLPSRSI